VFRRPSYRERAVLLSHHHPIGAQQEAALMLQLTRNNKLAAAIVALLVSVSAVGMSLTTARGGSEHPPVMAVAVLPEAARLQRKRRYAAVRIIRWRLVPRARENKVWSRRRRLDLRRRLHVHEWYARGPPRWGTTSSRTRAGAATRPPQLASGWHLLSASDRHFDGVRHGLPLAGNSSRVGAA
jgi:hypothetical protein